MGSWGKGVCEGHWSRSQKALNDTLRGLCFLLLRVMESSQRFLSRIVRLDCQMVSCLSPTLIEVGESRMVGSLMGDSLSWQAPRRSWGEVAWEVLALEAWG